MPLTFALVGDAATRPLHEGPDLGRYVLSCALVLVVLGALAFGLRKLVATTTRGNAARRSLQVIDVLPLGGKQRVCVVRCYDRTFALGVGDKEVGLIAEIDAAVSMPKPEGERKTQSFGAVWSRLAGRAGLTSEVSA